METLIGSRRDAETQRGESASQRPCASAALREKNARGPVSRVLSVALLRARLCGHSSRPRLASGLKQPTRAASRNRPVCRPYSVLHPVGFTVPALSPGPRCALAAPFRPYPSEAGRYPFCGTIPDPPSPRLWRTAGRYPAPSFRGARTFLAGDKSPPRPPGPLARRDIGESRSCFESGDAKLQFAIVLEFPERDREGHNCHSDKSNRGSELKDRVQTEVPASRQHEWDLDDPENRDHEPSVWMNRLDSQ